MLWNNCRITSREVVDDVSMSFGLFQVVLTDGLVMKRAVVKIVSKLLNFEQKTMSHGHRSGDIDDVNNDLHFAMTLKSKRPKEPNSMSNSIKYKGFAYYFLRFNGVVHYYFLS